MKELKRDITKDVDNLTMNEIQVEDNFSENSEKTRELLNMDSHPSG